MPEEVKEIGSSAVSLRRPSNLTLITIDYTLNNPDTLTKYKTAAQISQNVLSSVSGTLGSTHDRWNMTLNWPTGLCVAGAKIVEVCQKGDALLVEEIGKVYKGNKKLSKGVAHPTTVSPSAYVTPYTPLVSDVEEAATELKAGEVVKIQLGAQIDGFGTIVCDSVIVPAAEDQNGTEPNERQADLMLANYYANELLIRLMIPPGLLASGTDEEKAKASAEKAPSAHKITQLLEKVVKSYGCNLVENTTSWLFDRNEIEGKKKIILAPGENATKGEGIPEVGEVWGVEMGVSLGTGKTKDLGKRPTLHRRTTTTYQLKRPSSRSTLSEIVAEYKTFPFSLRQLKDERSAKVGVVECVRYGVLRQYEVVGDKDNEPVARSLTTLGKTGLLPVTVSSRLTTRSNNQEWYHSIRRTAEARPHQVQDGQEDHR